MRKNVYLVKFAKGLLGEAKVVAKDEAEARREALATCRFHCGCTPDWYTADDVVESVEPAETAGGWGLRQAVELDEDEFRPDTAKDVIAAMQAPDFSKILNKDADEPAV
jgi:hypothetical protein